jgi:manganese transport protein
MSDVLGSIASPGSMTHRNTLRIRESLGGKMRGWRGWMSCSGPAIVASIAYVDPGNFATNIQAGARYGYALLWVVIAANLTAMVFQAMSAKLGIVTGRNLAEHCRDRLPHGIVIALWLVSEATAMATDLAEFVGGALGLSLALDLPMLVSMVLTAILTYGVLMCQGRGYRPLELVILALVSAIGLSYLAELVLTPMHWHAVFAQAATLQPMGRDEAILAAGIVGATVMPHALFLHSGLTQDRVTTHSDNEKRKLLAFSNAEVLVALSVAGLVNCAMVLAAAGAFHAGHSDMVDIGSAYRTLVPLLGRAAGVFFVIALIASGISSSVVGTVAGQIIMQGFVGFRIPLWLRRAVTMLPAFIVIACGVRVTDALVGSQVVLSLGLPLPMLALLVLTSSRSVMGRFRNARLTVAMGAIMTLVIVALNGILLWQACT